MTRYDRVEQWDYSAGLATTHASEGVDIVISGQDPGLRKFKGFHEDAPAFKGCHGRPRGKLPGDGSNSAPSSVKKFVVAVYSTLLRWGYGLAFAPLFGRSSPTWLHDAAVVLVSRHLGEKSPLASSTCSWVWVRPSFREFGIQVWCGGVHDKRVKE